jgi:transposase-like protein
MATTVDPVTNAPVDPTSLSAGDYTSTEILNTIFSDIVNTLSVLQNAAAAQANRLNFLSNWQQAYTNLMGQVHTFIENNGDYIQGSSSSDINARNALNQLNSNLIQTLQNRQSVISDASKALQSVVNQSNDAVDQQSNLGTSIIQEQSSLLSTLYH